MDQAQAMYICESIQELLENSFGLMFTKIPCRFTIEAKFAFLAISPDIIN